MVNPKSVMTDRAWQLVTAIRTTMAGEPSTAEIIEMALSHYLHQQAEYNPTQWVTTEGRGVSIPTIAPDAHLDDLGE
ncbi:MAG: hypothetical protein WC710_14155 [Gallionella sp.]